MVEAKGKVAMNQPSLEDKESFRAMSRIRAASVTHTTTLFLAVLVLLAVSMSEGPLQRAGHPMEPWLENMSRVATGVGGVIAAVLLLAAMVPTRVTLHRDGVELGWLWTRRFVRFRDLTAVLEYRDNDMHSQAPRGIQLVHRRGAELVGIANRERRQHFRAAVSERVAALDRGQPARPELARDARTPGAWIAALRGLGSGATGAHRSTAVDTERLRLTVVDPAASVADRAAAAVALAASEGDGHELRRVARGIGHPRLRVAVLAAAARDDTALEAALDALSAEEQGSEQEDQARPS
jgi:hypothetical protein